MSGAVPVVGVVAGLKDAAVRVERNYVDAVLAAGGVPILIPAPISAPHVDAVLDAVSGVILAGGGDIDAGRRDHQHPLEDADPERDRLEFALVRRAIARRRPVLGVCRGAQLLAVATGGTLVPDLGTAGYDLHRDPARPRDAAKYATLRHEVKAEAGTLAERLLAGVTEVNSHHHQAIARPGDVLVATAWSPDGSIEVVEGPDLLGVQWHPEVDALTDPAQLRAFRWLVGNAGRVAS